MWVKDIRIEQEPSGYYFLVVKTDLGGMSLSLGIKKGGPAQVIPGYLARIARYLEENMKYFPKSDPVFPDLCYVNPIQTVDVFACPCGHTFQYYRDNNTGTPLCPKCRRPVGY